MTTVDWVIIGIVALSTVMSLWRGVTREIFSLATWALAIYLGVKFAGTLDPVLMGMIDAQSVRFAVGFIIIFLLVMIAGGLLMRVLSKFISFTGLTVVDRLFGLGFGAARGVLIIAVMVVLAGYSTVTQDNWYKSSQLLPHFDGISQSLSTWVQAQGFDPKKLETMMDSVDGKSSGQMQSLMNPAANQSASDTSGTDDTPASGGTPSTDAGVQNILGVPVPKDDNQNAPNMLGSSVAAPADTN